VAYRIQRRHPPMSGGFPASAAATGRWRAGLAAPAVAAAPAALALVADVALGMGRVVLRDGRAAGRGRP
jgi:hypothetical protein